MQARVTREFRGVAEGMIHPVSFAVGSIITGDLARAEVMAGHAEWISGPAQNRVLEVPETKGPFPTGAGDALSSPQAGRALSKKTLKRRGGAQASS